MDGRLSRRALLSAAAAGGLALVLPVRLRPGGLGLPATAAEQAKRGFRARLRIPPVLSDPQIRIEMRQARIGILPGPKTKMWTYGGSFPGPTIRRPSGQPTDVTFAHRLPREGRRAQRSPPRRPQPLLRGRSARRPHGPPAAGAVLPDLGSARARRLGQRPADRARRRAHLPLRPDRGRRSRAGRISVVPRPPARAHGPKRVAGARRDDDHRRRAGFIAAPAGRRARHPADARRPLVRQAQSAHRPVRERRPRAQRRGLRPSGARQRRRSSVPQGAGRPLPRADPQRGQLQPLQPRALRRLEADPDRDRERPDAEPDQAAPGADQPRRARRADPRLSPPRRRARPAAKPPPAPGRRARVAHLRR